MASTKDDASCLYFTNLKEELAFLGFFLLQSSKYSYFFQTRVKAHVYHITKDETTSHRRRTGGVAAAIHQGGSKGVLSMHCME